MNSVLVIRFKPGSIPTVGFLDYSGDESEILLGDERFQLIGNGFGGFHDWLYDPSDKEGVAKIVGVELFPHEDEVLDRVREFGAATELASCSIIFGDFSIENASSGGEQSFLVHQYLAGSRGSFGVLLDIEGVPKSLFAFIS